MKINRKLYLVVFRFLTNHFQEQSSHFTVENVTTIYAMSDSNLLELTAEYQSTESNSLENITQCQIILFRGPRTQSSPKWPIMCRVRR